jgi:large subunit ribosomal protein L17
MRHLRSGRKLTADTQHRLAMRRNLARAIFINGRITTTMAKAKATRPFVEKLVTRARKANVLKETNREAYIHQLRVLRRDVPQPHLRKNLIGNINTPIFGGHVGP